MTNNIKYALITNNFKGDFVLTREETEKWNIDGEHYICSSLLLPNYNYVYYFRILCDEQHMFYAFNQGCLISEEGATSYRSALRKHVLQRMIDAVNSNELCAIVKQTNNINRPFVEIIDKGNIARITDRYVYKKLIDKYGNTPYVQELHDIIDEWNQVGDLCNDDGRVNPKQIFVSLINDITFQRIQLGSKDPKYQTNDNPLFLNGIPLEYYDNIELVIKDGLVIGEINHGPVVTCDKQAQFDFMINYIVDFDQRYTLISNDIKAFHREVDAAKELVLQKKLEPNKQK